MQGSLHDRRPERKIQTREKTGDQTMWLICHENRLSEKTHSERLDSYSYCTFLEEE
jgi:hypothetical protein